MRFSLCGFTCKCITRDDAGELIVLNGMLIKVKIDARYFELQYLYEIISLAFQFSDENVKKYNHRYFDGHKPFAVGHTAVSMAKKLI
jgi:hypothetical protein